MSNSKFGCNLVWNTSTRHTCKLSYWFPSPDKVFECNLPDKDVTYCCPPPKEEPDMEMPPSWLEQNESEVEDLEEEDKEELDLVVVELTHDPDRHDLKGSFLDLTTLFPNPNHPVLVRSNGDKVGLDTLAGKHLLICCVTLPLLTQSFTAQYYRALIAAYPELSHGNSFEVLLALKVLINDPNPADDKFVFDHFFSAFPCLAVPYSNADSRDRIWSLISYRENGYYDYEADMSAILVDPTGCILQHQDTLKVLLNSALEKLPFCLYSGALAIDKHHEILRCRLDPLYLMSQRLDFPKTIQETVLFQEPLSLHKDILLCDPSHPLRNFSAERSLTVSQLSEKYVGLYLCADGMFMNELKITHDLLLKNNLELEIILVVRSPADYPQCYQHYCKTALEKSPFTSWFIFECDSSVYLRLWQIFGMNQYNDDKLIIISPDCKSGDLNGRRVVSYSGKRAFPLLRSRDVDKRVSKLRSLTPAAWFKGPRKEYTCLVRNGRDSDVPHSELQGKKLLLYLDWLNLSDGTNLCEQLIKAYPTIKEKGWEVVFVPLDAKANGSRHNLYDSVEWLFMPLDAAVKHSVREKLFFMEEKFQCRLLALGENYQILSREVAEKLAEGGVTESFFNDDLRGALTSFIDDIFNADVYSFY